MNRQENRDYQSALAWLDELGETQVKPGLARIQALMATLGDPQQQLRAVIVGGTNGKGTTCWLLEDALCQAGFRVGCATSPHLHSTRERLRLNQVPVGEAEFAALAAEVREVCHGMAEHPSYFEVLTAITLAWFARREADIVILEVGLGGELDAMNVIDAEVAVLTTLALEHTDWLGDNLEAIARTKAGIVRPGTHVITGWLPEFHQFIPPCASLASGDSAREWVTLALERLDIAAEVGETRPPGRRERAGNIMLDCAHNPHALSWLLARITEPAVVVFGCLRDKPLAKMLALLPTGVVLLACAPDSPRAQSAVAVVAAAGKLGRRGRACDSVAEALELAGERPTLVVGSSYLVAEARRYLGLPGSDES
jgi:folylpolyglutamate synthase/dihydropteroate synthase